MRPDLFKVIVERPRLVNGGSGNSDEPKGYRNRLARIPADEQPKFESNSRGRKYGGGKWLNENLAPLRRYLRKQVGRPWNKVHSEMCEHLSLDSAVKSHVLDHVRLEVRMDVVMVGKVPYNGPSIGWRHGPLLNCLYVHPRTGLLCEAPRVPIRSRTKPEPKFLTSPDDPAIQYHQIDGLWYEVRLAPFTTFVCDALLRRAKTPISWQDRDELQRLYGRPGVYGASKRQLRTEEIRRLPARPAKRRKRR